MRATRMEEGAASESSAPMEVTELLNSKAGVSEHVTLPRSIHSLHMPRLLGAIHITFFHLTHYNNFASAGNSWVTFFFMLSGFGAAHSKLASLGVHKTAESTPCFSDPIKAPSIM